MKMVLLEQGNIKKYVYFFFNFVPMHILYLTRNPGARTTENRL